MDTPLVCISGLLSNQDLWAHPLEHLNGAIQIISPFQDTPQKMVEMILKEAPDRFALAGHSMGGWLCLEVMRQAPSRVSKLCLLNTTAKSDSAEKKAKREEMIHRVQDGHFREVVKELTDRFVFNSLVKADVEKMFLSVGEKVFVQQEKAMLMRDECESILPSIQCPTLVVHAALDQVFHIEDSQGLVDRIPSAQLAVIEDCGHMSPLEKPQAVTSLLGHWLAWKF